VEEKAMKRTVVILVTATLFMLFGASTYAADKDFEVSVQFAGLSNTQADPEPKLGQTRLIYVDTLLGDTEDFGALNFNIPDAQRNEMLALLMAAATSGLTLRIRTDLAASGFPEIKRIFLLAQ